MNGFNPGDKVLIKYGTFHNPYDTDYVDGLPATFISYMAGREYAILLITEHEYYNVRVYVEDIEHA